MYVYLFSRRPNTQLTSYHSLPALLVCISIIKFKLLHIDSASHKCVAMLIPNPENACVVAGCIEVVQSALGGEKVSAKQLSVDGLR